MKSKNKKKKLFKSRSKHDQLLKVLVLEDKAEYGFVEDFAELLYTWSEMGCMVMPVPVFDVSMKCIDMVELKKSLSKMQETDWSYDCESKVVIDFISCGICGNKKPVDDIKTDRLRTVKSHLNSMGLVLGKDGLIRKR